MKFWTSFREKQLKYAISKTWLSGQNWRSCFIQNILTNSVLTSESKYYGAADKKHRSHFPNRFFLHDNFIDYVVSKNAQKHFRPRYDVIKDGTRIKSSIYSHSSNMAVSSLVRSILMSWSWFITIRLK